ncbi:MAG: universal stress protein [Euryarchaeota archaeon]|nr:universal stress protein [Euryarchaeota archaeon]
MEYKHILLATDGSELMGPVYEHCAYLARLTHATVSIVYVLDIEGVPPEFTVVKGEENVYDDLLTAGGTIVEKAKSALLLRGVDEKAITEAVLEGNPWDEIHAYVTRQAIDLVITGTHRRKGLSRLHIGSTVDRIIRSTEVPVLVVRGA